MTDTHDYRMVNRAGWRRLAEQGSDSSRPYSAEMLPHARSWLDPYGWLPWDEIHDVLCLGAGGGQQGPSFASLGCRTTVVDLSPDQLALDREAAAAAGLELECLEGDIADLSQLEGRHFDLVHQAICSCYVPDLGPVHRGVRAVLAPGGWYDVEHWNPLHAQLAGYGVWQDGAYELEHPRVPGVPLPWFLPGEEGAGEASCWHFTHHLADLVGDVCRAGFRVVRVAERPDREPEAPTGSVGHVSAYAPSFLRLLCRAVPEPVS
jgi:SAM-dependent methyltransferase